jgi:hypothetical protein
VEREGEGKKVRLWGFGARLWKVVGVNKVARGQSSLMERVHIGNFFSPQAVLYSGPLLISHAGEEATVIEP